MAHQLVLRGAVSLFILWLSLGAIAATTPRGVPGLPGDSVYCQLDTDNVCRCGPRQGTGRQIPCRPGDTAQPSQPMQQARPADPCKRTGSDQGPCTADGSATLPPFQLGA